MTIAEIVVKLKGEIVLSVEGEVVKTWPREHKPGGTIEGKAMPPYDSQNIILKDATGDIFISMKNQPEMQTGQYISIASTESKQHGWNGIKVAEWEGKKQLKVTNSAKLIVITGNEPQKLAPTPGIPPTAPNNANAATNSKPDWDGKEKRSIRSMMISYAKDLCVAGKIELNDIESMALKFYNFVYPNDQEIPF